MYLSRFAFALAVLGSLTGAQVSAAQASARPSPATLAPSTAARDTARPVAAAPRPAAPRTAGADTWEGITPARANTAPTRFPVGRRSQGAAVLHVQVLLSRALFSPGMLDGHAGRNMERAVFWLQQREGLTPTGAVDSATLATLTRLAGEPAEVVRAHVLADDDVRGPFVKMPEDIYEQAKLACSCFESLAEKLSERFHLTTHLLRRLNPGVVLDSLEAGDSLWVPNVRSRDARADGTVAELVVSAAGSYLHARDARGRILYHFPITLGSSFDPSPQGSFTVRAVADDPWWHYQPRLLAHVPDDEPDARIPPGPNSSVGRTWISLSVPHYGIHGTRSPETIGYATSSGCVRLSNWDVQFLSRRITPGTPVRFEGTRPGVAAADSATSSAVRADSLRRPPTATARDSVRRDTVRRDTVRRDTVRRDSVHRDPVRRDTTAKTPLPAARPRAPQGGRGDG